MDDSTTVETDAGTLLPSEYIDTLRPTIVRLQIEWLDDMREPKGCFGTGIVIGRRRDAGDIIIATARHVVEKAPRDRSVEWTLLQQHDSTGDKHRTITFTTGPGANMAVWHKVFDIAILVAVKKVIPADDYAEDYDGPAPVILPLQGAAQGTPVAWAGFPGVVERFVGHSQLVVHGGVVGAMIHGEGKRKRFIMDGHAVKGVSGGPVWHYSAERQRAEVVGIIVGPGFDTDRCEDFELPGYIDAEPIGPIIYFLEEHRQDGADWIITDCWGSGRGDGNPFHG